MFTCSAWTQSRKSNAPFIACQDTDFNSRVRHELLQSIGDYKAPWWYSPHLAVIIPFGHDHNVSYEREILFDETGGSVAIDWYPKKPELCSSINVCIFFPCLGGESKNVSSATLIFIVCRLNSLKNLRNLSKIFRSSFGHMAITP
jgi:hypothetical protein